MIVDANDSGQSEFVLSEQKTMIVHHDARRPGCMKRRHLCSGFGMVGTWWRDNQHVMLKGALIRSWQSFIWDRICQLLSYYNLFAEAFLSNLFSINCCIILCEGALLYSTIIEGIIPYRQGKSKYLREYLLQLPPRNNRST